MRLDSEKYHIDVNLVNDYNADSADNLINYDLKYLDFSGFKYSTIIGIKVSDYAVIKSAVIGGSGGATGVFKNSALIDNDKIIICCSDTIYCLSIPDLTLRWKTQADDATCFQIFKYNDSYIVHGELAISRLDNAGKILWQQTDSDIFATLQGIDDFRIMDDFILAKVWGHKTVKIDFNGKRIK